MSCNGCRVLRKGCSENCILRQSLEGTDYSPQAQANATLFVAKFFGRARLMSFLSSVPQSQRPALFHSLLHEACGRSLNPVTGALGFLSTGNWHVCQSAVNDVLDGRTMVQPLAQLMFSKALLSSSSLPTKNNEAIAANNNIDDDGDLITHDESRLLITDDNIMGYKRKLSSSSSSNTQQLSLLKAGERAKRRQASPSDDQSVMTTLESNNKGFSRHEFLLQRDNDDDNYAKDHDSIIHQNKLLKLFF